MWRTYGFSAAQLGVQRPGVVLFPAVHGEDTLPGLVSDAERGDRGWLQCKRAVEDHIFEKARFILGEERQCRFQVPRAGEDHGISHAVIRQVGELSRRELNLAHRLTALDRAAGQPRGAGALARHPGSRRLGPVAFALPWISRQDEVSSG